MIFVDGCWRAPVGAMTTDVFCASTEELLGRVPDCNPADVDAAVTAARRAFDDPDGWSSWLATERATALYRLADLVEAQGEQTARLVGRQNGMPLQVGLASEALVPAGLLRYYAYLGTVLPTEDRREALGGGSTTLVRRVPLGVVAAIVPWNYPQSLTAFKVAPALAAGCTVVIKPSPETVLDALLFAEAVERAGLPDGVVNVVPGGRDLGAHLVSHPGVDKVAFTGSTAAGRAIAKTCGRLLRPVTLELGGKSAAIILDDADLDAVAEGLFSATLTNNGQTCYLGTRILAPRSRYDAVVELVADVVGGLRVGDAMDPRTQIGPVASDRQRARVEFFIATGRDEGARLVIGGGRPKNQPRGWFVEPTVFADVDNASSLAQEEIFGPVLSVISYDGDENAVDLANHSQYGLGGSVWSRDPDRALGVARSVHTGTIGLNGYRLDLGAPFGGVKASGLGRELGPEGLGTYQRVQTIYHV